MAHTPDPILSQHAVDGKMFCFGLGYVGTRMAALFPEAAGTCRSPEKATLLLGEGIHAHVWPDLSPDALDGVTHLLLSVPPDAEGDPIFRALGTKIAGMSQLRWCAYLSSTGVYGDHGGDWVDENTEPKPVSPEGENRLIAEAQWLSLCEQHGIPMHVFRLSGIYGPGRNALRQMLRGEAYRVVKPGHFISRVHVSDIVRLLMASASRPTPGQVFNVSDDEPAPTHEVVAYAAKLLHREPPPAVPYSDEAVSPGMRRFYQSNRRVSNRKALSSFGISLQYPNYRAGLEALLTEERP
jgi:dTDP-4-dehydrorhamnose reductase